MEIQTLSRQKKKEKLLHFLETKREQREAISRERKEAKSVALVKKAIPFSRKEKREKFLQYLKERKEQLLAAKKRKEGLRLRAIAKKRKVVTEKKTAIKAKVFPFLAKIKGVPKATTRGIKGIAKKIVPAKKAVAILEVPVEASSAVKPKEEIARITPAKAGAEVKEEVKPVPKEAVKRKPITRKIELKVFLRRYALKILFFLLFLVWIGEAFLFYSMVYLKEKESDETSLQVKEKFSPGEKVKPLIQSKVKVAIKPELFEPTEIKIIGERDPFSDKLFRMEVLVGKRPKVVKFEPIIREEPKPVTIPPLIPESEKISLIAKVGKPEVPGVSLPKPSCPLRYRGNLRIAGIEYLFIEGKKSHQAIIGEIIEGYRLFNKIEDTIYLSKDGYIFPVRRKILLCPLHYRGRLIMDGKEYLFLEGKRTYRVALGETAEGYQVIKRTGNILYLLKDNNIFELKEE